ncbi:MAG TPA: MFS transporter [Candidatus Binatia bacterium]|nr:MFS transporter [Candidatus Binatia bacterium]
MSFSARFHEIRTGFERPFWIANISELFERLSYYAAFASLARYLHETLNFGVERASSLTGLFGGLVWFMAVFGGALADRLGFRRALSLAYFILSVSYFLLGSIGSPWMAGVRNAVPLVVLVSIVLMLPAFGVALVKPCVVGTTARASKENVRSIGYSIYYTLVNVGSFFGPLLASWVHKHLSVENVFRMAAVSVLLMFVLVLVLFKEPRSLENSATPTFGKVAKNFLVVLANPRFMIFLLIFTGYWIVFWQEFIALPLYISSYIDKNADTELILTTDPLIVICFTMLIGFLTKKLHAFHAIVLGTLVSSVAWILLIIHPSVWMAVATLVVVATGEIIQQPRYYDYISRLAPPDQQGTYMGFAFLPLGIGSLIGGPFSGWLIRHYGEELHQPQMVWWWVIGVGIATTILLWIYDRVVRAETVDANHGGGNVSKS